ncbi:hypothetical protein GNI_090300 [Gregarina niphandrodes]|uniref:Uncharacterized protein n=1 Tax=Gregarina niphandrodes TaxID=110365 RepID=A0A023B5P9_GRENI|nr:hypothetical protein GNI_090300 [Gregarina niphandrodes]EZG60554.1 hypothetical protein GNI_090300 [Gregarina niphandrodes]|eukprot:XP_011130826.1 hypothetical protein GNI_090300 [Gregarina niphandrodes]
MDPTCTGPKTAVHAPVVRQSGNPTAFRDAILGLPLQITALLRPVPQLTAPLRSTLRHTTPAIQLSRHRPMSCEPRLTPPPTPIQDQQPTRQSYSRPDSSTKLSTLGLFCLARGALVFSSGVDKSGVGPIKPSFDGASMISAQELAVLKEGSCREAFADLKAPLIEATMKGWEQLDWSDCVDGGGWVICTDDRSSISECYRFGYPYRFDFPTVWEAVVHRLKPAKCSFRCNEGNTEYRMFLQRGWVLVESIGEDPFRSSEAHVHQVGLAYPGLDGYRPNRCGQSYGYPCEPHISGADCYCPEATFWADVTTPSGKSIRWGKINHVNTYAEDLLRYYSVFKRPGYNVTQCDFRCRRLQRKSYDDALHDIKLTFYNGTFAGQPPINKSRCLE